MRILIMGATGFLGTELAEELVRRGHDLVIASRKASSYPHFQKSYPARVVKAPIDKNELAELLPTLDACVNLAGEPLADKRWTSDQKKKIYLSRISGTRDLVQILANCPKLKTFISGSAIGIYGNCEDTDVTEDHPAGTDFLAEVCQDWEDEALTLNRKDVRTVLLRSAVVLGRGEGVLKKLENFGRLGILGPLGSGNQYMSWIHVKDWVAAAVFALENSFLEGPINLSAPEPVSNRAFTRCLGEIFQQKIFPPVPAIALRIAVGEISHALLTGQKVLPQKLQAGGFKFSFPNLAEAFQDIFGSEKGKVPAHHLESRAWLPANPEEIFAAATDYKQFKGSSGPLEYIAQSTESLHQGTLIDWKIRWHGLPISYRERVEQWQPISRIVIAQTNGPLKSLQHTQTVERLRDGTLIKDSFDYELPAGVLGEAVADGAIRTQINQWLEARSEKLTSIYSV